MEMLRIWNSQNNFEKKQIVELMTIRFQDYKETIIKIMQYLHMYKMYREMDQNKKFRNRPHMYDELIIYKDGKVILLG